MNNTTRYLFVYGTLLDESNPYGAYLHENAKFYASGKIKGKLYDIGNYPGAIADTEGDNYVYGSIYEIKEVVSVLKELDDYEGFGDDFAQPNEFIRVLTTVEANGEKKSCWIYVYNFPTDGLTRIDDGRYRRTSQS